MDDFIFPDDLTEITDEVIGNKIAFDEEEENLINDAKLFLTLPSCQTFSRIIAEYKEMRRRIREIDELAKQLAFGVHLQSLMDKCSSERGDFPIRCSLRVHKLASNSFILLLNLKNSSEHVMHDWYISVSIVPIEKSSTKAAMQIHSSAVFISHLSKDDEFSSKVLISSSWPIPSLIKLQLVKQYSLGDNPCVFLVNLEPIYFSWWSLIEKSLNSGGIPRFNSSKNRIKGRIIEIPEALVYLICDEDPSEIRFLNWILCSNVNDGNCDNPLSCFFKCDFGSAKELTISVRRNGSKYVFSCVGSDPSIEHKLLLELQLRVLIKGKYIRRTLNNKKDVKNIIYEFTIPHLFDSYTSQFIA